MVGTKGAYEVGCYKAMKELGLHITAVVGTSIGAINSALIVQDDFEKMKDIYDNIKLEDIIDMKEKINENKSIFNITNIVKLAKEYTRQKGFTNQPLQEMLEKNLDLEKIYASSVDLGIVTYSLKTRAPLEKFKSEIPKDKLIDHLLASACFPIYKAQKIGETEYMDGGFYDNMPINMLLKKGYKNIIVVDLIGIGLKRKVIDKDIYLKMIRPNEDLGGTFEFNKERMQHNIQLGYLDTLKVFNKIQGHIYYFGKREFTKLMNHFSLKTIYGLEYAASVYKMDKYKIYTMKSFLNELLEKQEQAEKKYQMIKTNFDPFKEVRKLKTLIKMIDKGLGLCFFMDIVSRQPIYRTMKIVNEVFSDYIAAGDAMIELKNESDML